MIEFFNASEHREINLLMLLFEQQKWWTVQEIAAVSNCSADTMYSLIDNVNRFAESNAENYCIEVKRRKGIYLHVENTLSLSNIYCLYFQNSIRYKIIDAIFQQPNITPTLLGDQLYFSKSTIYRELTNIKKLFEQTNLTLDITKLEISGDELLIRHFMLNMYWPILIFSSWPFTTVSQPVIEHRRQSLFEKLNLAAKPNISLKVDCQLAINFMRHQTRNFVTHLPTADGIAPDRKELVASANVIYAKTIPQPYRENELNYLATFGAVTDFCAGNYEKTIAINQFHQENQTRPFQIYTCLVACFKECYADKIDFTNQTLRFKLLNLGHYATTYPGLRLDFSSIEEVLTYFSHDTPHLINNLRKITDQVYTSFDTDGSLINRNDFILDLYLLISEFVEIERLERPIRIKIISQHPGYESTMRHDLRKRVTLNLDIDTSHIPIAKETVYDLILSEVGQFIDPTLQSKASYAWVYPPSVREWQHIENLLIDIAHNKLE